MGAAPLCPAAIAAATAAIDNYGNKKHVFKNKFDIRTERGNTIGMAKRLRYSDLVHYQ